MKTCEIVTPEELSEGMKGDLQAVREALSAQNSGVIHDRLSSLGERLLAAAEKGFVVKVKVYAPFLYQLLGREDGNGSWRALLDDHDEFDHEGNPIFACTPTGNHLEIPDTNGLTCSVFPSRFFVSIGMFEEGKLTMGPLHLYPYEIQDIDCVSA